MGSTARMAPELKAAGIGACIAREGNCGPGVFSNCIEREQCSGGTENVVRVRVCSSVVRICSAILIMNNLDN